MHGEDRECLQVLIDAYGPDRVLAEISRILDSKAKNAGIDRVLAEISRNRDRRANVVQLHAERINSLEKTTKNPPTEEYFAFCEPIYSHS